MKKIYLKNFLVMAALLSGVGIVMASDLRDCPSSDIFITVSEPTLMQMATNTLVNG